VIELVEILSEEGSEVSQYATRSMPYVSGFVLVGGYLLRHFTLLGGYYRYPW
jgi:hypothetical protein